MALPATKAKSEDKLENHGSESERPVAGPEARGLARAGQKARAAAGQAKQKISNIGGPSPNPMTNLILTDLILRGGGEVLRQAVERGLLTTRYDPKEAKRIVSGRGLTETLIATTITKMALSSVPGAILVGGGLLAKTLYDKRRGKEAQEKGRKALARRLGKDRV